MSNVQVGTRCRVTVRNRVINDLQVHSVQTPISHGSKSEIIEVKIAGKSMFFKLDKFGVLVDTERNHTGRWTLIKSAKLELLD